MGIIIFEPVSLTLEFDPFIENVNLANNFLTMSVRDLIFHMNIPLVRLFHGNHYFLDTVTLTYEFDPFFLESFNLANNLEV